MEDALKHYRAECDHNMSIDGQHQQRELQLVKDEILNLSDRFDFFIASLINTGMLKNVDNDDALLSFKNRLGGNVGAEYRDGDELRKAFNIFKANALESDLGGRQKLRENSAKNYSGSHLQNWLDVKLKLKSLRQMQIKRQSSRRNSFLEKV